MREHELLDIVLIAVCAVSCGADDRVEGEAPHNFTRLRHIALNLPRQELTAKIGVQAKGFKAGWSEGRSAENCVIS